MAPPPTDHHGDSGTTLLAPASGRPSDGIPAKVAGMPTPPENLNPDGNLVSNETFAEYMAPIEAALSDYAVAVNAQADGHGYLPAASSQAMAELDVQRAWATASWSEPVRNAHSYASTLLYTLIEHVAAFAAIIAHTKVGPSQSHRPTLRAVFEITPIAHWLFDPTISAEKRVKRSIAYRLKSANESGRMQHLEQAVQNSKNARNACKTFARHNGWAIRANAVDDEKLPVAAESFSTVVFGGEAERLDRTLWSLLSASTHGTWYAISEGFAERMVPDPLDPSGGFAPVIIEAGQITMFALMVGQSLQAVATARSELMGWPATDAMIDALTRIETIGERYTAATANS